MTGKTSKRQLETGDILFLNQIVEVNMKLHKLIYENSNILLGINGVLLVLTMSKITSIEFSALPALEIAGWMALVSSLSISILLILLVLKPTFRRTEELGANLFYYRSFLGKFSEEEYAQKLDEVIDDRDSVIESYSSELYSLANDVLLPKFRKLEFASVALILGLVIGILLIVAGGFL